MARPRCDVFDAPAIRAAIDEGATTERAAYLAYAATAGRPYARSTFSLMLRRPPTSSVEATPIDKTVDLRVKSRDWQDRMPVKPRILSLSAGGGLRVLAGSLIVFDGATTLTYSKSAKPPLAIVLSTVGGFVSMEAVRFCARGNVAIVALDRAHGFLTVITGAPKASAAMLRAQVRADPMPIARTIVAAKITALRQVRAISSSEQFMSTLDSASNLDQVRNIEAQASRVAWPHAPALRWQAGQIPADWRSPWLMRVRLDAKGKRGARHPINAMLNAAFAVTAGRLVAYLAGLGLSPAIGFLHADKPGRWSLAWDAIEILRPQIEARLFLFVERHRFAVGDFVRTSDGGLRLAPGLLRAVLNTTAPPPHALAATVRWMVRLIAGEQTRSRELGKASARLSAPSRPFLAVRLRGQ
jgi:CRISP-associated protein Cas1